MVNAILTIRVQGSALLKSRGRSIELGADRLLDVVNWMELPQRADRRIAASVLARALDPLSRLLVIAIEERGAGEGHLDRRVQVAVGAEVGPIDEGGELVAG